MHSTCPQKEFKTSKNVNRNIITLDFKNKLMEKINIHGIFKEEEISDMFPFKIHNMDNSISSQNVSQPTVSYRYNGDKNERKILNCTTKSSKVIKTRFYSFVVQSTYIV